MQALLVLGTCGLMGAAGSAAAQSPPPKAHQAVAWSAGVGAGLGAFPDGVADGCGQASAGGTSLDGRFVRRLTLWLDAAAGVALLTPIAVACPLYSPLPTPQNGTLELRHYEPDPSNGARVSGDVRIRAWAPVPGWFRPGVSAGVGVLGGPNGGGYFVSGAGLKIGRVFVAEFEWELHRVRYHYVAADYVDWRLVSERVLATQSERKSAGWLRLAVEFPLASR